VLARFPARDLSRAASAINAANGRAIGSGITRDVDIFRLGFFRI
jgi:hypothetical protein